MNFNLKLESEVIDVDSSKRKIKIRSSDKEETLSYDTLILATGGSPIIPGIRGINRDGVFTVRTIDDGVKIKKTAEESKNAVIIGGGLIGLEMADALSKIGLNVTIVELLPQVLITLLDKDMTKDILKRIEERNIKLILGKTVNEVKGSGGKVEYVKVGSEEIPADLVIVSTAVRPNVDVAKKVGVQIGETGGVRVNLRMETSVKGVYACGDCAEVTHLITGKPTLCQLGTMANKHGKIAGINAAGGYSIAPPVLIVAIVNIFGLQIGHVGLTEQQSFERGISPVVARYTGKTKADYFPDSKKIDVKLIFEQESGVLTGAQLVGEEDVATRTNFLSAAITQRMTAIELEKLSTGYTPPLNNPVEPIVAAAEGALRCLRYMFIHPIE